MPKRSARLVAAGFAGAIVLLTAKALWGNGSDLLPIDDARLQYTNAPLHNRVSELQNQIDKGELTLKYNSDHGYLEALLNSLKVPVSSQLLVFSKTSFQAPRISPRTPRAIYHSDDLSLGYVKGGDVLEIAAVDPQMGTVFYTLDQDNAAKPRIERRAECLQCHIGASTAGVPGLVVRSMYVARSGMALFRAPSYITDHRSPLEQRWGGWYVTGTHGSQVHMGNEVVEDKDHPDQLDPSKGANVTDLSSRVDTTPYLRPGSDIVSLMVLEHKTRMVNVITRVGFEARLGSNEEQQSVDELIRYMLFIDEAPLTAPIKGDPDYAKEFVEQGPRDSKGRSLRDLDMQHRMFRYPCSFLIYSKQFDALPQSAKDQIYKRLFEILSCQDTSNQFAKLTSEDRHAILEILRDTKPGLPAYWKQT